MNGLKIQTMTKANHWRDYERAFRQYAGKAERLQSLMVRTDRNQASLDAALIELERARQAYNGARDMLARELLSSSEDWVFPAYDGAPAGFDRVRSVAGLRWEASGRPEGTAEEDWLRAEEIVGSAA
jgi:Protein of unknown function (DUF2934)